MKCFFVGLVFSFAFVLIPVKSHAGIIGDILKYLFDHNKEQKNNKPHPGSPSNSVPLEGTVFLLAAGLAMSVKLIVDRRKHQEGLGDSLAG